MYWPPIYAFIRSRGASPHEAEDLTQGFFAAFLARDNFSRASKESGKLRSFMLGAVKNFMANDWRHRCSEKRGGGVPTVSLDLMHADSHEKIIEVTDKDTPESVFDRQWALTLLHAVIESLEKRYEEKGQKRLFDSLSYVIYPGGKGLSYAEIAAMEDMSESAVKVAAHRLKKRYASLLRQTIADTLIDEADVDSELRDLMAVFS